MVFIAIFSTGCSESIAVSTLVTYDIYRQYINPDAMGVDILFVSRVMIVVFGVLLSICSIILYKLGLNLGWVYLFMGIVIGSAVIPLWNLVSWKGASGTGAVVAAWLGLALAIISWLTTAKVQSGVINTTTLGTNEAMLCGNLVSILSSGLIHWLWSTFIDPQDFDLSTIDAKLSLVERDKRGLSSAEKDPQLIEKCEDWIKRRSFGMTFVLIFVWPLLALPAGIFSKGYFAFWVFVCIVWAFTAAVAVIVYPITESSEYLCLLWTKFCSEMNLTRHPRVSPPSEQPPSPPPPQETTVSTNLA
jgi:Na+/proline symporter